MMKNYEGHPVAAGRTEIFGAGADGVRPRQPDRHLRAETYAAATSVLVDAQQEHKRFNPKNFTFP
ncbi:hypothetical protein [Serratia nematodiphila]|uniref:hypothetical protein n=1 Tax=Serratia nematodiphila TaxID=458197 RepID=UPI001650BDB3|nr:hypothetical protein [Serratia nematodiphila]